MILGKTYLNKIVNKIYLGLTLIFRRNLITLNYEDRVREEGFTIEALDCVDAITETFS